MSKLIDFYNKHLAGLNKYWIVTLLFVFFTFLIGDSSLYNRIKYDEKIRELEGEIARYKKQLEEDRRRLNDFYTNKSSLEQFAREEYLMKKPDEDIFIIEE